MKNARLLALTLALLLLLMPALAFENPVDDLALAFSPGFVSLVNNLSQQMDSQLDAPLLLVTRHFLGGKSLTEFYRQLLENEPEMDKAILFVLVIGEEKYQVFVGEQAQKVISPEKAEALLNGDFRDAYLKDRAYERAVAGYLIRLAESLSANGQAYLDTSGLTSYAHISQPVPPLPTLPPENGEGVTDYVFENPDLSREYARRYDEDARVAADEDKGLSIFQIAIFGFILYKLFGRKNRKNGNNKKGCGPLGFILGVFGISKLFGWRQ